MGKKSPPPKAPDLSPISDAQIQIAKESNELAREYLGLSREQYAWMQENAQEELALARQQADYLMQYQDKVFASEQEARDFAKEVGQLQMDATRQQMEYAQRDRQRYESVFLPMQDRYIQEANEYDTPARREQEAARAMVDIQRQADAARTNADQRLRSMGVDPSQMRSASLLQTQGIAMAAQQAMAGNAARQQVEDKGRAMRADALNVGAGLPAQSLAGYAGAGSSGAGAIGAGQAAQQATLGAVSAGAGLAGTALGFRSNALNNVAALTGSPMQWAGMGGNMMGQASSGYGNAANTMSQNFQNQMSSWQAGQQQAQQNFSNIMSVASMAGGMMMAEGGLATRRSPIYAAEGIGPVERERIPVIREPINAEFERVRPMAIDTPAGPSMADRVANGLASAGANDPGNVWADQPYRPSPMMVQQTQPQVEYDMSGYYAEGGGVQRARGALPVRQSRDVLPAFLAEGEYVVPADVVRAVGLEKLDKMVQKYHRENA
jgi:hypothetical protein